MLRWRLFGINFCIEPSFWFMNALWALLMAGPLSGHLAHDRLLLLFIALWLVCTFVSVMVHELGHVSVGRLFGQPGNIVLTGLGGQAVGSYDELSPWQRMLVIVSGPLAGFGLAALIITADSRAWDMFVDAYLWDSLKLRSAWITQTPLADWHQERSFSYVIALNLLTFINLFVNVINLLPIMPMDGGMLFKEVCCLFLRRQGLKVAFAWSFALACVVTLYYGFVVYTKYRWGDLEALRFYPFALPEFGLCVFASLAFQSYQAYQQLSAMERYLDYMQDDDFSGPRLAPGIVEVPAKDPRDFAPRAPGSEKPR